MYPLEHFYYGQLVHHGKATGDVRVLARSEGVTDELISAAVRNALIPSLPDSSDGSWAIVRGNKTAPYILAHVQVGSAGQTTLHFIFLPSEAIRAIAGDLSLLIPFVKKPMPVFDRLGDTLVPLTLATPTEQSVEQQSDILLELMMYTKNNPRKIIQPLLSAVVRGVPLVVKEAPVDIMKRTNFVQGLLTMLPSSTRFGVMFATHLEDAERIKTQIMFMNKNFPDKALLFNWETGDITGEVEEHEYARFMSSQLSLDTTLFIRQAQEITPVAGWRFKSGSSLAEALAYASYRSKLDKSLSNNMPVEVAEVARVLSEDPTLDDKMRIMYAEHLLTFSLALDDLQHIDPIAVNVVKYPSLASTVLRQMNDAVRNGKAPLIFETLQRWMTTPPPLPGEEWANLTQLAALRTLGVLVAERDFEAINVYLDDLNDLAAAINIDRVAPQILQALLPYASEDAVLPTRLLLLAMRYMNREAFQHLLMQNQFTQYLSRPLKEFLISLSSKSPTHEDSALLKAVDSVDEAYRDQALLRLSDVALTAGRSDLLDTRTLEQLTRLAVKPEMRVNVSLFLDIARTVNDRHLKTLGETGARHILQLFLACGRIDILAMEMSAQSRDLYGGERQFDYVRMVFRLFAATPLYPATMAKALDDLEAHKIKGVPLLAAQSGALEATTWSDSLRDHAMQALKSLENNKRLLPVIHPEIILALLRFFTEQSDQKTAMRVARLLPTAAARKDGKTGLTSINEAFKLMRSDEAMRSTAFEIVRQYVREADDKPANRAIRYFGKELGPDYARKLDMSYIFSRMMGQMDLATYSSSVSVTVSLLKETYETYSGRSSKPSIGELTNVVNRIRVGIDERDRQELATELRKMTKAIVVLGDENQTKSSRNRKSLEALATGSDKPRSVLDIFRVAGGYLAKGKFNTIELQPHDASDPFHGVTPEDLRLNIVIASDMLGSAVRALPPDNAEKWTTADIHDELDSMRQLLPTEETREITRRLALDWQYVSDLVALITKDGNSDAIEDDSRLGKRIDQRNHQPRNTLEMYRFIYGYFLNP